MLSNRVGNIPDFLVDDALMGVFKPEPFRFRANDLLFVFVGCGGVLHADRVSEIGFIVQNIDDGVISPSVGPGGSPTLCSPHPMGEKSQPKLLRFL